ncbi:MAG TPA: hypothetical protein VGC96_13905 [Candidatus Elarobacter sp.]|jgi:hypothetical protein
MTRGQACSALFAGAAAFALARPASADGLIRFRNVTFGGGVTLEVRVGDDFEGAALYGTRKLARGESWEVDTTGVPAWWRREVAPGSNDGRYTAWVRVDSRTTDARVDV